jgi:hypothetical protein
METESDTDSLGAMKKFAIVMGIAAVAVISGIGGYQMASAATKKVPEPATASYFVSFMLRTGVETNFVFIPGDAVIQTTAKVRSSVDLELLRNAIARSHTNVSGVLIQNLTQLQ